EKYKHRQRQPEMNRQTHRDDASIRLIETGKNFEDEADNTARQRGQGQEERGAQKAALAEDGDGREDDQRDGKRRELEGVFVPVDRPVIGREGIENKASGEGGEQRPGKGEEGESPAGIARGS